MTVRCVRAAAPVALVAAALSTCAVPDRPSGLVPELPAAAIAFLAPDTMRGLRLADGVFYHFAWSARGPWAVHVVTADLTRCDISLDVVPALEADGATRTRRTVTQLTPRGRGWPVAGVNGDFFVLRGGAPVGPEVTATTSRLARRPAFAWGRSRLPWIGDPLPGGDGMGFGPDTVVDGGADGGGALGGDGAGGAGALRVIGGYPVLLVRGAPSGDLGVSDNPSFAAARHPRTAVGFDHSRRLLRLVVVDGRQAPVSVGMSLPELADLMLALGTEEALNLDGGGSSAMSLRGRIVSRPSDPDGERTVANSLWLVRDQRGCAGYGGAGSPAGSAGS